MIKRLLRVAVAVAFFCSVSGAILLPKSRHLAGPLDSAQSAFGDEFFNFPAIYKGRAAPGSTHLSGWIEFRFSEPAANKAEFTVQFNSVGTDDGIAFPGGQTYTLVRNRAFNNELLESRGTLNLDTGEVDIEIHAIFLNTIIARVDKNIRIPFGFPNDYPPVDLPVPLPFQDRPNVFRKARFTTDASGKITGFEFRGETIAPVTVFPSLGLFPPYAFGDEGKFYFANPTGCLPGAIPQNCPNDETNPDGILLPKNAFFHPHFELITSELREIPERRTIPPCAPSALASGGGLVAVRGRLYQIGGFDGLNVTGRVQIYDPSSNQWGQGASLPFPVLAPHSVAFGSRIYAVGGWDVSTGLSTNLLQIFDAANNRWSVQRSLPIPVAGGVAAAVGAKLYIIGGWTNDRDGNPLLTAEVQVYDPSSNAWSSAAKTPIPTAGSSAVVVGSNIYLINGRTEANTVTNRVSIYDTLANAWNTGPPTIRGVYEAAAGYSDNRVYLVGGRVEVDGPSDSQRMQILELSQNRWRDGHEQPIPTATSAAAVLDAKFYVIGGRTMLGTDSPPGAVTDAVQLYDPALGWSACDTHPLFTSASVLNAAAGTVAPLDLSPGSRAVILGHNFAASTRSASPIRFESGIYTTDLPTSLNGIGIRVDGQPAPIFFVSPSRVEFQIPYRVAASSRNRRMVQLELIKEGSLGQQSPIEIPILAAAPGIYVYHYGELREPEFLHGASAIARNMDGKLNHPSQPARPGEAITLQVTGLGLVDPLPTNGQRAGENPASEAVFSPRVFIGGKRAKVVSASLSPRQVGMYDLKAIVPPDSPRLNNVPVEVIVNGVRSNRAAISVK